MMKRHCVTLFCVLFVLSLTISSSDGRNCVPGKGYHDGCNYCKCFHGELFACTFKRCEEPAEPPPEDIWLPEVESVTIGGPIPAQMGARVTGRPVVHY